MALDKDPEPEAPKPKRRAAEMQDGEPGDDWVVQGQKSLVFTPESILKELASVQEARGKKVA